MIIKGERYKIVTLQDIMARTKMSITTAGPVYPRGARSQEEEKR